MAEFDPHFEWLGIPPEERPCDLYRLLNVPRFSPDLAAINAAADARMTHLRKFQTGPRGSFTQKLLNEISSARVCLTNPKSKAEYDDALRAAESVLVVAPPVIEEHISQPPLASSVAVAAPPRVRSASRTTSREETQSARSDAPSWIQVLENLGWEKVTFAAAAAVTLVVIVVGGFALRDKSKGAPETAGVPASNVAPETNDSPSPKPKAKPAQSNDPFDDSQRVDEPEPETKSKGKSKKPKPPPEEPIEVFQELSGEVNLPATLALLGGKLKLDDSDPESVCISNWRSERDSARWRIKVSLPGKYRARLTYGLIKDRTSGVCQVTIGDQITDLTIPNPEASADSDPNGESQEFDVTLSSVGIYPVEVRATSVRRKGELFRLVRLNLAPLEKPDAGAASTTGGTPKPSQ